MMQVLQTEILDWVDPKDFNPDNYSNDSPIGCFQEVVLVMLMNYLVFIVVIRWRVKK